MPIVSCNSKYQAGMVSMKMFLISTGVLSMGVFLKLSVPVMSDFFLSQIPSFCSSFISCLTPPYLYLLINFIIITILASSKLQQQHHPESPLPAPPPPPPIPIFSSLQSHYVHSPGANHFFNGYTTTTTTTTTYNNNPNHISDLTIHQSNQQPSSGLVVSEMTNHSLILKKPSDDDTPISSPITSYASNHNDNDKTPVSSRIRQRKQLIKPTPEGKPLGVSKPKKQDTLESTWRTITEGRSMPLTRHLRKSDTWESHGRRANLPVDPATPPSKVMKKSETFSEGSGAGGSPSPSPGGSGRLKREASLTQDELNRRVEAFIKKFNDEMRLQRQESFKHYQEMMGRGAH